MAGSKVTIHDEETAEDVEQWKEAQDHDSQSKAANELVQIGLREARHPIIYRWYQRGADIIGLVLLIAVMSTLAGLSGVWPWADAGRYAVAAVAVALGMLCWLVLVRVYYGQTELGDWIRGED